jgi:hypothetical protein
MKYVIYSTLFLHVSYICSFKIFCFTYFNLTYVSAVLGIFVSWKLKIQYLRTTVPNQNHIEEGIKSRLNSGNSCSYSVQNLLSTRLLSKNLKVIIYKIVILPFVFYKCENRCHTLKEANRSMGFWTRVLRIFWPEGKEAREERGRMYN